MHLNCGVGEALESSLDNKEIKPVNPRGRTDAETPILWLPDAKNLLIGKGPDAWERLKAGGEGDDRG